MARDPRSTWMKIEERARAQGGKPADPLRRARHETFAKAFAFKPDAKAAAIAAGYPRHLAVKMAGRLLSVRAMSARIQHLQIKDAECLTVAKLVQELYIKPKVALAKAIVRNPFTGETRLDLGRLTPVEVASLEFSSSVGDGESYPDSALKIHSGSSKILSTLGRLISDPTYAPQRKEMNRFEEAFNQLLSKRNTAPIRSGLRKQDD